MGALNKQKSFIKSRERGDILPLALSFVFCLVIVCGVAIDFLCAFTMKAVEENNLTSAREACMTPAFSLAMKNEEDPGDVVAKHLMQSLRDQGYGGKITVWFYELPQESVPLKTKRVMAYAVQLEEKYETTILHAIGLEKLDVATYYTSSFSPYSETVAWRPSSYGNGVYTLNAGTIVSQKTYTNVTELSGMPQAIRDELDIRLEQLK